MQDDKQLIKHFQNGDHGAFRQLYNRHIDYLINLAMHLLADRGAAEDAVQDVLTVFVQHIGQFRLNGSLKSYLATCVANRARDLYRRQQRRNHMSLSDELELASNEPTPFQSAARRYEFKRIAQALEQLPWEQREIITLRLHGDLKFRDIARLQRVSVKTVQSRYRYGLNKMRQLLSNEVCHETSR